METKRGQLIRNKETGELYVTKTKVKSNHKKIECIEVFEANKCKDPSAKILTAIGSVKILYSTVNKSITVNVDGVEVVCGFNFFI